jgi:cell division transport system ATP-binding protein
MVKFRGVTKTFGEVTALKDINFEVAKGDFVFLMGPSGSGKTTVLKLILGEIRPSSGEIFFNGVNVTQVSSRELPKLRQKIGCLFQDFKLLNTKTVAENLEMALAVIGLPEKKWPERVAKVLDLVGLANRQSFFPAQLSGGELQRVALARALVVEPELILADEPTGNLDWDTADKILELLLKVNKTGKTVIVATHNREIVAKAKKKVVRLKNGKVTEEK